MKTLSPSPLNFNTFLYTSYLDADMKTRYKETNLHISIPVHSGTEVLPSSWLENFPMRDREFLASMVHLYLCMPDRCWQKIHKSKGDRQCKIGQKKRLSSLLLCIFCQHRSGRQRYKCTIKEELHLCMQALCMHVTDRGWKLPLPFYHIIEQE